MEYSVYILRSRKNDSLYIGHTNNLARRILQHNAEWKKTYTAARGPWDAIYYEVHATRGEAVRRELFLKSSAGAHEKKTLVRVSPLKDFG
jgi:putative endonuclease